MGWQELQQGTVQYLPKVSKKLSRLVLWAVILQTLAFSCLHAGEHNQNVSNSTKSPYVQTQAFKRCLLLNNIQEMLVGVKDQIEKACKDIAKQLNQAPSKRFFLYICI